MDPLCESYRDAVCTRIITMLSPPADREVAAQMLNGLAPRPVAVAPERILVDRRVFPASLCAAMVAAGVLLAAMAHTLVERHKKIEADDKDDELADRAAEEDARASAPDDR